MRNLLFILFLATFAAVTAFNPSPVNMTTEGSYGVCDCQESKQQILLTVSPDHTFRYLDKNTDQPFDIKGKWKVQGKTMFLYDYPKDIHLHNKWSWTGNKQCIKSRLQMNFRRLCRVVHH